MTNAMAAGMKIHFQGHAGLMGRWLSSMKVYVCNHRA